MDKNGGSAFPTQTYDHGAAMNGIGVSVTDQPGMTLRDYFAAAALQGWLASLPEDASLSPRAAAKTAYELADAMLEAREEDE